MRDSNIAYREGVHPLDHERDDRGEDMSMQGSGDNLGAQRMLVNDLREAGDVRHKEKAQAGKVMEGDYGELDYHAKPTSAGEEHGDRDNDDSDYEDRRKLNDHLVRGGGEAVAIAKKRKRMISDLIHEFARLLGNDDDDEGEDGEGDAMIEELANIVDRAKKNRCQTLRQDLRAMSSASSAKVGGGPRWKRCRGPHSRGRLEGADRRHRPTPGIPPEGGPKR